MNSLQRLRIQECYWYDVAVAQESCLLHYLIQRVFKEWPPPFLCPHCASIGDHLGTSVNNNCNAVQTKDTRLAHNSPSLPSRELQTVQTWVQLQRHFDARVTTLFPRYTTTIALDDWPKVYTKAHREAFSSEVHFSWKIYKWFCRIVIASSMSWNRTCSAGSFTDVKMLSIT